MLSGVLDGVEDLNAASAGGNIPSMARAGQRSRDEQCAVQARSCN